MHSYIIFVGLIILIIFSPIAVGSVYIVTYSAMEIIVFGLLLVHIWKSDLSGLRQNDPSSETVRKPRFPIVSEDFALPSPHNSKLTTQNSQLSSEAYFRKTLFLMLPMFIFLTIVLFQLIPLPFGLLKTLSPGTGHLYQKLGFSSGFYPLTLSVYATTSGLLKWCAYAGVLAIIVTFNHKGCRLKDGRWIIALLITIFAVAFFEAVYGLYIAFNRLDSLLWFTRRFNIGVIVTGTWINPNHLAGFMNMAILCSLGLFASYMGVYKRRERKRGEKFFQFTPSGRILLIFWIALLGLLVMILASTFSLSRMGHVSLLAGLAFMIILYSMRRLKAITFVLIIVVSLGFLWGVWKGLEPVMAKWNQVESALYSDRRQVWKGILGLSGDFPLIGTGLGTFEIAYPPYKPAKFGPIIYDHAHNDYLEVLSEVGLAGFIAWIAFFAFFFYSATRAWLQRHDAFARGIGAGGIAATLAILAHALADFNLQIPANALALFIIMGLTWRALHTSFRT